MQCKCGGDLKETNHEVKTIKGANNWIENPIKNNLPLNIEQHTCNGCGRCGFIVYDNTNKIIKRHNI